MSSSTVPETARPARRAGVLQGVLLLAGSCLPVLGSVLITPVLPQLSEEFAEVAGAAILVPMIVAIPALMIALFAPFAGQIVDRVGRKRLLIITMIAYALAGTAPAWLEGLSEILVSRVLVGICEAAIMTVCTTLIVDYFHEEKRRRRYLGLQTVVTSIAATIFIALGGALGANGWHTPFWVYAISIAVAIPMIFALWEPKGDPTDSHAAAGAKVRIPWGRILGPLLITLFGGFTFYVLIIEVSYLVVGTGVAANDTATIGGVATGASLAAAIGGLSFARLGRLPHKVLLPLAFGLQALGMLLVWIVGGMPGIVAGAIVASLGSGILLPALLTWVVAATKFEERGRVTGLWTSAFFLGQFLTPILMGIISGVTGSLTVGVGAVGIAAAVMALALGLGIRTRVAEPAVSEHAPV